MSRKNYIEALPGLIVCKRKRLAFIASLLSVYDNYAYSAVMTRLPSFTPLVTVMV